MILLESALTNDFWAFKSRTKDNGMPHVNPWPVNNPSHKGLCTHVAVSGDIFGFLKGLTAENTNELRVLQAEKTRESIAMHQGKFDGI